MYVYVARMFQSETKKNELNFAPLSGNFYLFCLYLRHSTIFGSARARWRERANCRRSLFECLPLLQWATTGIRVVLLRTIDGGSLGNLTYCSALLALSVPQSQKHAKIRGACFKLLRITSGSHKIVVWGERKIFTKYPLLIRIQTLETEFKRVHLSLSFSFRSGLSPSREIFRPISSFGRSSL